MKVSIIVPVYNQVKTLRIRMSQLLKQDYDNFELILVDDGSTDGSAEICDELKKEFDKVRVFHKQNGGVSSARNLGLSKATGKYIIFCDADDDMESDALSNLVDCMEKSDADLVIGGFTNIQTDGNGNILKQENEPKRAYAKYELEYDFIDALWQNNNMLSACGKLFKGDIISENIINFNEGQVVLEDYCFVLEYLMHCKNVVCCNENVYNYYRTNNIDSLSRRNRVDFVDDVLNAYNLQTRFFSEHNVNDFHKLDATVYGIYIVSYEWLWTLKTTGIRERLKKYRRIRQVLRTQLSKNAFSYYKKDYSKLRYWSLTHSSIVGILMCNLMNK